MRFSKVALHQKGGSGVVQGGSSLPKFFGRLLFGGCQNLPKQAARWNYSPSISVPWDYSLEPTAAALHGTSFSYSRLQGFEPEDCQISHGRQNTCVRNFGRFFRNFGRFFRDFGRFFFRSFRKIFLVVKGKSSLRVRVATPQGAPPPPSAAW